MRKVLILMLIIPFLSGCGTFFARVGNRGEAPFMTKLYPATSIDYHFAVRLGLTDSCQSGRGVGARTKYFCMGAVDAPISLVTDTVCLPVDLFFFLFGDERSVVYPSDKEGWGK